MKVSKLEASLSSSILFQKPFLHQESCDQVYSRRIFSISNRGNENNKDPNIKKARLFASKQDRVKIPVVGDRGEKIYRIREFLSHPSGIEALLNTHALQSVEQLNTTTYRCTVPPLSLLNFEVTPLIDLRVTPTDEDCLVEMLSCKFEGSEVMKRQNEHFSAEMTNHITWCTKSSEPYLDVNVKLNLTLEIYTRPFSMLPISAVEAPGTLMMQALVDRLVPLLLQQLIQDYERWVTQNPEGRLLRSNS